MRTRLVRVRRRRHRAVGAAGSPEVVAVKVPTDRQYVRNLQREGVTAHGLRHPNIVRVRDLVVEGQLPRDLNGTYYRNGPNPAYEPPGRYHWFDGDGMIHSLRFEDGRASYHNRWVASAGLRSARVDLTESKLYTLSTGSRAIASKLTEPITLTLYYSDRLAAQLTWRPACWQTASKRS